MKKYFLTGLIILLPLALTLAIVAFLFNLLTVPFLGLVTSVFEHYHFFESGLFFLNADHIQTFVAQLLILGIIFLIVLGLGFFARWLFLHTVIKYTEGMVKRIPLVRAIYQTCQEVIETLFKSKTQSFKQVVLVPFPNPETFSLGFVTRETLPTFPNTDQAETVVVFVPTAPNPTSGFIMMFKASEVHYIDMKVKEAFKTIISCGVIYPDFKVVPKNCREET